ncbi:alcohol oxidase [Serendipita vermifera]|nr:alcohol oxidase [Serendipita vermifera]
MLLLLSFAALLGGLACAKPIPANATRINLSKRAGGVTWNVWDAAWQTFDYVVVGGGLTGLTVASRLAENPATKILVIEAGGDNRWDSRVYDIYTYGQAFGSELDWQLPTDQGKKMIAGKTLGGSSSINGAAWTRGIAAQYDAWSTLLEPSEAYLNWNWDSLFQYMKKAETWSGPNDQQRAKGADGVDSYHGFNGPVQVTFPDDMYGGPQQGAFLQSIQSVTGIAKCPDINGGQPNCVAYTPFSMNWHDQDHRSYSASAYLTPVEWNRPNWLTLVNHQVSKLLWATDNSKFAYGVEFRQADNSGDTFQVYVRKEVILAAGAINTPALLQRSGVGDPAVMNPLGIPTVLNIPTVGKNMQEQTMSSLGSSSNGFDFGGRGPSDVIAFPNLYELFGNQASSVASTITSNIGRWANEQAGNAQSAQALRTIYETQADLIINKKAPVVEVFYDNGWPDAIGILVWPLLPWSRGTIKITSSDAFVKPQINVNYLSVDMDMTTQVASARLARKVMKTAPLSNLRTAETIPGGAVPDDSNGGTDANWKSWIQDSFNAVNHPLGTCAMMRRDLGGVVDGRMKLYGAQNVRIVDASVMPMQISAHLSSTLYGMAEKIADMIKNGL